jgi:hypothetical protein
MRTPAGTECRYFYGDYYRGRNQEECRLLMQNPEPQRWTPDLCRTCPVPSILRANACPHMILQARVARSLLGLRRQVKLEVFCDLSQKVVTEPQVGCGICHPLPEAFTEETHGTDTSYRPG